jgi:hypothetical protein
MFGIGQPGRAVDLPRNQSLQMQTDKTTQLRFFIDLRQSSLARQTTSVLMRELSN